MSEEVKIILITALCNGAVIFLFQLFVNAKIRKNEKIAEYKKEIKEPYFKQLYKLYQCVHVKMETMFYMVQGDIDQETFVIEAKTVYYNLLELDAYYEIYKKILDKKGRIKKEHKEIQKIIFEKIKPTVEMADDEVLNKEIIDSLFLIMYNDLKPLLMKEAEEITANLV